MDDAITRLNRAVEIGSVRVLRKALQAGADANSKDKSGKTPLIKGILKGRLDVVQVLLSVNADVNIKDTQDLSPLELAIETGHVGILRELIIKGNADVNIVGKARPLHLSAEKGRIEITRELIDRGADVNALVIEDRNGASPLHVATEHAHLEIVNELIKGGAKVNITEKWGLGSCPLHLAVKKGHIRIARHLIDHGADVNIKDLRGSGPLHLSVMNDQIDAVRELTARGADVNIRDGRNSCPLHLAIRKRNLDISKHLIDAGARIDVQDAQDSSPLHLAITNELNEIAILLIHRGADVNMQDGSEFSSLHLAINKKCPEIARELINRGADVQMFDGRGSSCLHLAIENGFLEIIRDLITNGADVNIMNKSGSNPLYLAIKEGQVMIANELITNDAGINIKDAQGSSPLHLALEHGHIDIVRALIGERADVNANDRNDSIPLQLAIEEGNVKMARLLINAGNSDVNIQFGSGSNPLHLAIEEGNVEITRELIQRGAIVSQVANPLRLAIERGHTSIVRELIKGGAVVNSSDGRGSNLMHLATKEGNVEIVRAQVNGGARVNLVDDDCFPALARMEGSYLHTSVTLGYDDTTRFLLSCEGVDVNTGNEFGQTLLHCAMQIGNCEIVDELLAAGCDPTVLDAKERSVLHIAAIYGYCDMVALFIKMGVDPNRVDKYGSSSLFYGVLHRQDDVVKVLLEQKAVNLKPSGLAHLKNLLHSCEKDCLTGRVLRNEPIGKCIPLRSIPHQRGIGSVHNIYPGFVMKDFADRVKKKVEKIIQEALPVGSGVEVIGCGSSFEGSKVGLPDELDFLIELFSVNYTFSETEGYGKMERDEEAVRLINIQGTYGVWLWNTLTTHWRTRRNTDDALPDDSCVFKMPLPPQRHPDRKTCTSWVWLYSDGQFKDLPLSIDFVPAIRLRYTGKPRSTWMMTVDVMKQQKHCYVVPKIPHGNSQLSRRFEPKDLNQLGRISFPTLEVDHLLSLDQRLLDVFISSKCLRKPEVCGFKWKKTGRIALVKDYITSYILKTAFLHLVELFLTSEVLSLGKMVLMVYEVIEGCLERGRLPLFFDPAIDVLAGSKTSREDSLEVAKVMTKLARSMYERDYNLDERLVDLEEETRLFEHVEKHGKLVKMGILKR